MNSVRCVLAVAVLALASMGMIGCGSDKAGQGKGKPKKPPRVKAVAAEQMRLVEYLETTGNVVAVNTVMLAATIEGPIIFCPWREGDRIDQTGQKLVEIERPLYRREVAAAKAAEAVARAKLADLKAGARPEEIVQAKESVRHLDDCTRFAKVDLDRIKSLVESGSLPGEEVEKARVSYVKCHTQLGSAKESLAMLEAGPTQTEIAVLATAADEAAAREDLAQAKLDECAIKAPFAGMITEVFVRPGDLATPRTPLLKMMDPLSLVVRAGLPESCAAYIKKGIEVTVRLDAYPDQTFNGKIERVFPQLEMDSRTRMIEVRIIDPVELIPRLFARISVQGRVAEEAIVVPGSAIVTTPRGDKIVYVVEEGQAELRKVAVGLEQGPQVQITKGVQPGEMVVIAGNLNLKDGAKVQLDTASSAPTEKKVPGDDA
jgi:multidrug resistance efflux pump